MSNFLLPFTDIILFLTFVQWLSYAICLGFLISTQIIAHKSGEDQIYEIIDTHLRLALMALVVIALTGMYLGEFLLVHKTALFGRILFWGVAVACLVLISDLPLRFPNAMILQCQKPAFLILGGLLLLSGLQSLLPNSYEQENWFSLKAVFLSLACFALSYGRGPSQASKGSKQALIRFATAAIILAMIMDTYRPY